MRKLLTACFFLLAALSPLPAQEDPDEAELLRRLDALKAIDEKKAPAPSVPLPNLPVRSPEGRIKVEPKEEKTAAESAPTEITATKEATFDEKTRIAVFLGNVRVKDPQFNLAADKLTAFMKKAPAADRTPASSDPNATKPAVDGKKEGGSGLDRAIAEGHVVITQDKPSEIGKPPVRYVGRGKKADYNATTGEVTLSGNPQVQQGINTHIATEESTVMIMQKGGQMKTLGGSRTLIQDQDEARPQ